MSTATKDRWVIHPDEDAVLHVWVEEPPSLSGWEELLSVLHAHVAGQVDVVLLEGPGWSTPYAHELAGVLGYTLGRQGVRVLLRGSVLADGS
jgi:hypothetical protein